MSRTSATTVSAAEKVDVTNVWTAFGHSYINYTAGTYDQTGRMDALFRSALRIENSNWANYAINGARLTSSTINRGGWTTVFYETQRRTNKAWPYVPQGGGALICHGLNDLGNLTNTAQMRTAYVDAMRAVISRWRASTVKLNTDASIAYGAGFTALTGQEEQSTTGTLRQATTTTNATITITLPADYTGEVVSLAFVGKNAANGGTVTFSGTAGVTGTLSTSATYPASQTGFYNILVKRITNLTSANAGQTIVATATAIDASGSVWFDSYWLEAKTPQPVIMCNIARLTAAGYGSNYASWTGTESNKDADVQQWNQLLTDLVANEFDSMVQIADVDAAWNKDAALMTTAAPVNLHPNEFGAAKAVDAILAAVRRLRPPAATSTQFGKAAFYNPSAPAGSSDRLPHGPVGNYFTAQCRGVSSTTYTCVAGDQFAIPFSITEADTRWDTVGFEVTNAPTTGTTVRIGLYQDVRWTGYPRQMLLEWSTGVAVATTAGFKSAAISWEPDPGLYWLVMRINVAPTTVPILRQLDGPCPQMPQLATTGLPITTTTMPMAWKLTGQPNAALQKVFPSGATLVGAAPYLALKRAAPA